MTHKNHTFETLMAEIKNLWTEIDFWKAMAIDYNIEHATDYDEGGLFEATYQDMQKVLDIVFADDRTLFGVGEFGTTVAVAEVMRYLTGAVKVLEPVFTLHDGDKRYDVPVTDISKAHHEKVFNHPETDEPMTDWEDNTYMHYRRTESMTRLYNDYKNRI